MYSSNPMYKLNNNVLEFCFWRFYLLGVWLTVESFDVFILHFCWKGQKTITRYLFCAFLRYYTTDVNHVKKDCQTDFTKGLHLTPKNSFWRLWLLFFLQKPFPFYHQMSDTWHICAKKGQKHFFSLKMSHFSWPDIHLT